MYPRPAGVGCAAGECSRVIGDQNGSAGKAIDVEGESRGAGGWNCRCPRDPTVSGDPRGKDNGRERQAAWVRWVLGEVRSSRSSGWERRQARHDQREATGKKWMVVRGNTKAGSWSSDRSGVTR